MILCESLLMAILTMLGLYVTYTDFKSGVIQNKAMLLAGICGIGIDLIYYVFYCRDIFWCFLINLAIMIVLATTFYGFHLWAAGDSKLLICVNLLFPARLYGNNPVSAAPGINAIIYMFILAYLYLVIDSLIHCFRRENFYGRKINKGTVRVFLTRYAIGFLYLRGLNELLRGVLGQVYYDNQLLFSFVSIFAAMFIHEYAIFKKWYMLVIALAVNLIFIHMLSFSVIMVYSYVILFLALALRFFLNGYNYQEIETKDIKKGMVLSYASVMLFMPSRVKGLPQTTFEDMRSRLSDDEVAAIQRWRTSQYGHETITIVRKIPFAIFIILGEIILFVIRIWR